MKKKLAIIGSALGLAVAAVGLNASSAQAVTGGNLTNSCNSFTTQPPRAYYNTTYGMYVNVYYCHSTWGTAYQGRVLGLRVPVNCSARSQYTNPGAADPYKGGVFYPYTVNNLDLQIKVVCWT